MLTVDGPIAWEAGRAGCTNHSTGVTLRLLNIHTFMLTDSAGAWKYYLPAQVDLQEPQQARHASLQHRCCAASLPGGADVAAQGCKEGWSPLLIATSTGLLKHLAVS